MPQATYTLAACTVAAHTVAACTCTVHVAWKVPRQTWSMLVVICEQLYNGICSCYAYLCESA